jgi:hypothetical protein
LFDFILVFRWDVIYSNPMRYLYKGFQSIKVKLVSVFIEPRHSDALLSSKLKSHFKLEWLKKRGAFAPLIR